ncbi:glutamate racemase [Mammaliicoccus vitulinus]|uniref:glutamate racemase n=1 Tax=Mammaliicoccus vitulinus TaxID=71237 RepID=UPI000D1D8EFD|nr:aspartate/glutamate racemase family protein [Mammaliicoccus vitulinus]HAL09770.1 hypothetical protein [Staphylococcus sp.]MBO3077779.1 aspartate/glutamate racemase family protein [Mammaliicoccus vitulinus]PTI38471.1 hypothetical protein BU074_01265 [Mammaliicoccus vitulinus]PTI71407.1 hypothetical protein BU073_07490 [Mammaliicoccus vitulinus]QJF26033.1 hypothetical protein HF021_11530 [Mammaliicoccus vitulinus]
MTHLQNELIKPIAVFDAGIGSYSIVELLKKEFPGQDLIYLADRNQFPYGQKTKSELKEVIKATVQFLEQWEPSVIIIASNAPTITVLDDVKSDFKTEVIGVYPPIKEAVEKSTSKQIGILGAQSLIESEELDTYIQRELSEGDAYKFNASSLVELVETSTFISDKYHTLITVKKFIDHIIEEHEDIDVFTLSSTHLPWLYSYFKELYPHIMFINPAHTIIEKVRQKTSKGNGIIKSLVTTNDNYRIEDFETMLEQLNIQLELEEISIK